MQNNKEMIIELGLLLELASVLLEEEIYQKKKI